MPAPIEPAAHTKPERARGGRPVTAPVFLAMAEDEVARAWRYDRLLSVALACIDEMPCPTEPDTRLRAADVELAVLDIACTVVRVPDRVALVGPGELAILLPEAGARQAHAVAERLRERVAAERLHARGIGFDATLSIGTASLTHHVRSARQMLLAARLERRRAQADGGNRVMTVAPAPATTGHVRTAELH